MAGLEEEVLSRGLATLGLDLSEQQQIDLLAYLRLLHHWNTRFNLTAVRDAQEMVTRHLLDSLATLRCLDGGPVIDIGTGAGLPGIPLAIAAPEVSFTLLDSHGKRTKFLTHVKTSLGLQNITVVKSRVEDFNPKQLFSQIWSRAFSSLDAMILGSSHLLRANGEFVALKGKHPDNELAAIKTNLSAVKVVSIQVPGLAEDRCVVRFSVSRTLQT
ncbi:MAG: 16S rRNA (guanine(527)-N(7))-methyltransferase RsmG [Pseudomonadota bacterium]